MQQKKVLVVGASGAVGGEITKILKAEGHEVVEATSREATRPGQVHLNLVTGEGVKDAFRNIDRAFFLSPPGIADQYAILKPLIDAAQAAQLEKVVLMTALGANAVESSPFRQAEIALEKSGVPFNIIRPNWFLQNFHTFWLGGIKRAGKILLPVGQAKVGFIDARDIAAVAAKLLVNDELQNQAFDLTGGEAFDHDQVAAALSQAAGRKIVYEEISPAAMKEGLLGAGLPEDYADFMLVILGALKAGYAAAVTDSVQKITGRAPRTLAGYAKDFAAAWK